ncbi:hypothetical protein LUZ63_000992 [Rhynchospora breviuscula]|uniref:Reverse transcriptase zinc-binding domain-containing protein n=1 Tax=Rhynchospora breviuscula TaxID=2022672 RepID=A0A9Q0CVZ3_9POAL|nr:hypothetical protein LUZ63_000992 [Rhynchospora breviuscula]
MKSELFFLNADPLLRDECSQILQCPEQTFPIRYLGLPLTFKKLNKSDFTPLITSFEEKLDTWSSSLLSMAGRLVLVNSCLSTLPVYFMSVFKLPRWVIKELDSIRRAYLWQGHSKKKKLITIAWDKVCSPKIVGGLGVLELESFNSALLAKWLWKWFSATHSPWQSLVRSLFEHNTFLPQNSPLMLAFQQILPAFHAVTFFSIGNGAIVLFWHHNWGLGLLALTFPILYSFSLDHDISVANFLQALTSPLNLFRPSFMSSLSAQTQFNTLSQQLYNSTVIPTTLSQDQIHCKLTSNCLTSSSFYKFLKVFPKIPSELNHIWKLLLPPRLKTFLWLMLHNKLPTIDNLQKRGLPIVNRCCLCKNCSESIAHTFGSCSFFKDVTNLALNRTGTTRWHLQDLHPSAIIAGNFTNKQRELLTFSCYFTWRERCSRTVSDHTSDSNTVAFLILEEWRLLNPD